ncbi:LysR family transcriptional regulator [Methylobacterium planeticum]|uniref:LysR family transcriptional regulator n=1 Tax=Methylobacterium planeticum TaxID=2615211 RepID=A0A6N6MS45_9HYPH|nr:LysR family transcriptional regulator [Methylobacterium planeticum]KAB1073276.1 LysR family transcriptional regulator [Methylobacterium planeticum]
MDRIDALRVFARVVEGGSFSRAAREIGIGQPAVSKAVAALEAQLGVQLLTRTSRTLSVTPAGQDYYEATRQLLDGFAAAEERVAAGRTAVSGTVRVTSSPALDRLFVIPRLPEFRAAHPDMSIEMDVSGGRVDLIEAGVDVAIRIGRLPGSSLTARRIGTMRMMTVASADYVRRRGRPEAPADLAGHDRVAYIFHGETMGWGFVAPEGPLTVDPGGFFRSNDAEHLRAAVRAGLGVAHTASWLFSDLLASGEVVPLLRDHAPEPFPIHAVTAQGRRVPSRVRLYVDFLARIFAAEPELRIE